MNFVLAGIITNTFSVPTLSPSVIRRPLYSESESSVSPILQSAVNTPNSYNNSYGSIVSAPSPLVSLPSSASYPFTNFPELDDATFTGVDMFLLDQFSNPSNPLDFGSLDFDSCLFNGEGVGFGVAAPGVWSNSFGGSGQNNGWS